MIRKVVNFPPEWVAGFTRNQWQLCSGMGGRFEPESAHGPDRLNKACRRALGFGFYSYRRIKNILDRGLEEEVLAESMELPVLSHENIRGSQYYQ